MSKATHIQAEASPLAHLLVSLPSLVAPGAPRSSSETFRGGTWSFFTKGLTSQLNSRALQSGPSWEDLRLKTMTPVYSLETPLVVFGVLPSHLALTQPMEGIRRSVIRT